MHSSTFYRPLDLKFDRDNLVTINQVKYNCLELAKEGTRAEIKLFIEETRVFHQKKELIFYVNARSQKYHEPILSKEGSIVKNATKKSLSELNKLLNLLEYDINNPPMPGCPASAPSVFIYLFPDILAEKSPASSQVPTSVTSRLQAPGFAAVNSELPLIEKQDITDGHKSPCLISDKGSNVFSNSKVGSSNAVDDNVFSEKFAETGALRQCVVPMSAMAVVHPLQHGGGGLCSHEEAKAVPAELPICEVIDGCEAKECDIDNDIHPCEGNLDKCDSANFTDVQNIVLLDAQTSHGVCNVRSCDQRRGNLSQVESLEAVSCISPPPPSPHHQAASHPCVGTQSCTDALTILHNDLSCTEINAVSVYECPNNVDASGDNANISQNYEICSFKSLVGHVYQSPDKHFKSGVVTPYPLPSSPSPSPLMGELMTTPISQQQQQHLETIGLTDVEFIFGKEMCDYNYSAKKLQRMYATDKGITLSLIPNDLNDFGCVGQTCSKWSELEIVSARPRMKPPYIGKDAIQSFDRCISNAPETICMSMHGKLDGDEDCSFKYYEDRSYSEVVLIGLQENPPDLCDLTSVFLGAPRCTEWSTSTSRNIIESVLDSTDANYEVIEQTTVIGDEVKFYANLGYVHTETFDATTQTSKETGFGIEFPLLIFLQFFMDAHSGLANILLDEFWRNKMKLLLVP